MSFSNQPAAWRPVVKKKPPFFLFRKKIRHSRIRKKKTIERLLPLLLIATLLLAGGMTAGYFQTKPFLRALTQRVFTWIQHRAETKGIEAVVLEFGDVRWEFPDRVSWEDVSLVVHAESRGPFLGGVQGVLKARELVIRFPKVVWGEVRVVVRGGFFAAVSDPDPENRFEFFIDQCQLKLHVPWWPLNRLRVRLAELFNEIFRILKDGKTRVPIKLSGRIRFPIFGKQEEMRIWLVKEGEEYRLVMNPDDLKRVAGSYIEKISDPEIEVLARYPLRVSKALRITDQARKISHEAFERDKSVPEDAFRHVWWSYCLTKVLGPEFSKDLTDAHEVGSTTNTEPDHIMDYRNNEIGSQYALQGYSEESLLERTRNDPEIFRSTSEVYRRTGISDSF